MTTVLTARKRQTVAGLVLARIILRTRFEMGTYLFVRVSLRPVNELDRDSGGRM